LACIPLDPPRIRHPNKTGRAIVRARCEGKRMLDTVSRPAQSEIAPLVYTLTEVSILLKLAPSTIYDLHHEGVLTIKKIGNKSYILKTEIEALLQSCDLPRGPKKRTRGIKAAAPVKAEVGA
jgi:hypothetical protein